MDFIDTDLLDNSISSPERRAALLRCFAWAMEGTTRGCAAEIGAHSGVTSRFIALNNGGRIHYAFESFQGLVNLQEEEKAYFKEREYELQGRQITEARERMNLPNLKLLEGMFPDTITEELKREQFAFVHFDGDSWQTCVDTVDFFNPRVVPHGVILFDDVRGPVERYLRHTFGERLVMVTFRQGAVAEPA